MTDYDDTEDRRHRRERGMARLRAVLNAHGLVESGGHDDDLERPTAVEARITVPTLPPDDRNDDVVCQLCIRTVHRQRRRRRVELDNIIICCGACYGAPNVPGVERAWLRIRQFRRVQVATNYGIDPATFTATEPATVDWTEFHDDAMAVVPRSAGQLRFAMPRNFWTLWADRGGDL